MSSPNAVAWVDGQAVTTEDLQAMADDSATAEDRLMRVVVPPTPTGGSTYDKRVVPLFDESASRVPYQLVVPGSTTGRVKVRPCQITIGAQNVSAPNLPSVQLSGVIETETQTGTNFASTTTPGQSRIDVVYALIQRGATGASREVKDSQGSVSTQTVNVRKPLQITIGIQQGTEAVTPAAPSLPSDSSTAWYVPLAYVTLVHPYSAGAAITQAMITQGWPGGWIPQTRRRKYKPASAMAAVYNAGINGRANVTMGDQFGAALEIAACMQHVTNSASWVTIDAGHDWRYRIAELSVTRLSTTPGAASPPTVGSPLGTTTSGPRYTGVGLTSFWDATVGSGTPSFRVDNSTGELQVQFNFAPNGSLDVYWIAVKSTEQFRQ